MNSDRYDPLKYRGDAFEWFAEYFFKFFDGDNLFLSITDYEPAKASPDYGVDGVAKYSKDLSEVVGLQHKFKSNTTKKTVFQRRCPFKLRIKCTYRVFNHT